MKLSKSIPTSLLLLAVAAVGTACTADAAEDDVAETSDELRRLDASEVVGAIAADGRAITIDSPALGLGAPANRPKYRALRFEARAGDRLTAEVHTPDGADTLAYILRDDFATLARNDDVEDAPGSRVAFRASRTGVYYLAFRTKEGQATRFFARLAETPAGGTKWTDGWPTEDNYGRPWPPVGGPPVNVEGNGGFHTINASNCGWADDRTGYAMPHASRSCRVDAANAKISCSASPSIWGSLAMDIAPDGTFRSNHDEIRIAGRVYAGGLVTISSFEAQYCRWNGDGRRVYDAVNYQSLAGVVQLPR
ncbi:MAG: hypothetical protein KF894_02545 [Labilithrix sp.]|nr:hypothetical protein [Labilithrix sp.]